MRGRALAWVQVRAYVRAWARACALAWAGVRTWAGVRVCACGYARSVVGYARSFRRSRSSWYPRARAYDRTPRGVAKKFFMLVYLLECPYGQNNLKKGLHVRTD